MEKAEFLNQFGDKEKEMRKLMLALIDFKMLIRDDEYEYNSDAEGEVESLLKYKFLRKYDCDKIFGEMFGYEHTDTMNSFWTIFKQYIKFAKAQEFELKNVEIKKDYIEMYKQQYGNEITSQQLWIIHILNLTKQKNITFSEDIKEFAKRTHSIGNFIKVPALFNSNRYANTLDYFDLTLFCIYKWYETSSDIWLEVLLNNNEKGIQNTKEWLLSYNFETKRESTIWQRFIVIEDLQDFVTEDLKPIELFEGHFSNFEKLIMDREKLDNYYEKAKLLNPQNIDDLLKGVTSINEKIISRGKRMVECELENMDNNEENLQREFNNLIVTNKTKVEFPVIADILNYSQFYEMAISEEGITIKGTCYFDIDLLDEELYSDLKTSFDRSLVFFRIDPMYVTDKILDWKV